MACVLVTNDDGWDSDGIRILATVAREAGFQVVVAAPSWNSSGSSASLTAVQEDGRFLVADRQIAGLDGVPLYAAEAAPGFIVTAAMSGAFGAVPDLVLSGVNHGANTGRAILHSGTVGAALTAATHNRSAMAVSVAATAPRHWETVVRVASTAIHWVAEADPVVVLNVNVPDVGLDDLRGIEPARLARYGMVQANVTEKGQGYVGLGYTTVDAAHEEGTDAAMLAAGYATVTALHPTCEAEFNGGDLPWLQRTPATKT